MEEQTMIAIMVQHGQTISIAISRLDNLMMVNDGTTDNDLYYGKTCSGPLKKNRVCCEFIRNSQQLPMMIILKKPTHIVHTD